MFTFFTISEFNDQIISVSIESRKIKRNLKFSGYDRNKAGGSEYKR